jgi:hypothetical protein
LHHIGFVLLVRLFQCVLSLLFPVPFFDFVTVWVFEKHLLQLVVIFNRLAVSSFATSQFLVNFKFKVVIKIKISSLGSFKKPSCSLLVSFLPMIRLFELHCARDKRPHRFDG